MKRKGSRILQMALTAALSFTWLMGSWGTSVTGLAEGIRADGDWYYLYGDFSGRYFKMSPKSETLWRYTDADTFAQVEIGQQNIVNLHPGNFGNTIKAWRAPADGTVSLKGSVKLLSDPRAAGSDSINGIRFSLLKRTFDGKNYGPAQAVDQTWDDVLLNDPTPVDFTVDDIDVCAGDLIALSVNNNGCNDSDGNSVTFQVGFTKAPGAVESELPEDLGCSAAPIPSFSDQQGKDGWFYAYGLLEKYVLMDWGHVYGDHQWTSKNPFQFIGRTKMHPYGKFDNLKIWVSDFDGEIAVDGYVARDSAVGDGSVAGIYFNGQPLWKENCDYMGRKYYRIPEQRLSVKKGDTVMFTLGTGAQFNESGDSTDFITNIYEVRVDNRGSGIDLKGYLHLADDEAELLKVNGEVPETEEPASREWFYLYGDFSGRYFQMFKNSDTLWRYTDTDTFAQVEIGSRGAVNLHPGNYGDTIKAWRAPADGVVNLSGSVQLKTDATAADSRDVDGIRFSLEKRSFTGDGYTDAQVLDASLVDVELTNDKPVEFSLSGIEVHAGDLVALSVNNNGCNDSDGNIVLFQADFTGTAGAADTKLSEDLGCSKAPIRSYSNEQGKYGWFYAYGHPEKYLLMTWNNVYGENQWASHYPYQFIGRTTVHPYGRFENLKIWVSDIDGEIAVDGYVSRTATEGDGAVAALYFNGQSLWRETCDYMGKKNYRIPEQRLKVKKGDTIIFALSAGERYSEAGDGVSYITNIYELSVENRSVNEGLTKYLSLAKNEAELIQKDPSTTEMAVSVRDNTVPILYIALPVAAVCAAAGGVTGILILRRRKREHT